MAREDRQAQRRTSLRDKARTRAVDNKYSSGKSYLRLPEGVELITKKQIEAKTYNWDILPFEVSISGMVQDGRSKEVLHTKGELEYVRTVLVHEYMGANERHYICPKIIGKPCPFCEERQRLSKLPPPSTTAELKQLEDEIGSFKPKVYDLWNLVDRDDAKRKDGKPKVSVLEFSNASFREPLEEELRQGKEEWGGFADLWDGYTVRARFSEETFGGNKYHAASRIDFDSRSDYGEDILQYTVDLDACLIIEPYDKLRAVLYGADGEEVGTTTYTVEKTEQTAEAGHAARQAEERQESVREEPARRNEPVQEAEGSRAERGRRAEPESEPAKEQPVQRQEPVHEAPATSTRTQRAHVPDPEPPAGDCPSGHKFAVDCDSKAECAKCPTSKWEPCRDAADKLAKK